MWRKRLTRGKKSKTTFKKVWTKSEPKSKSSKLRLNSSPKKIKSYKPKSMPSKKNSMELKTLIRSKLRRRKQKTKLKEMN